MIFTMLPYGGFICEDWCDLTGDDIFIGEIVKSRDGYFRFMPIQDVYLTCSHLRLISEKISKLNRGDES